MKEKDKKKTSRDGDGDDGRKRPGSLSPPQTVHGGAGGGLCWQEELLWGNPDKCTLAGGEEGLDLMRGVGEPCFLPLPVLFWEYE